MFYFFGQPVRFVENSLVDMNLLTGIPVKENGYVGYRTDYSDVTEIVDRKYWQPSTVAVSQVGKHFIQGQSMYDSSEILKSSQVARLNASIRHPSNDIVETSNQLNALKKITIEVVNADLKAQADKLENEKKTSASNDPSTPPEITIGG